MALPWFARAVVRAQFRFVALRSLGTRFLGFASFLQDPVFYSCSCSYFFIRFSGLLTFLSFFFLIRKRYHFRWAFTKGRGIYGWNIYGIGWDEFAGIRKHICTGSGFLFFWLHEGHAYELGLAFGALAPAAHFLAAQERMGHVHFVGEQFGTILRINWGWVWRQVHVHACLPCGPYLPGWMDSRLDL